MKNSLFREMWRRKGKREADGGIGKSRPKASKSLHCSMQVIVQ